MLTEFDDVWFHRILHALRDVELAVRGTQKHDGGIGIHEVAERVAILRAIIEKAAATTIKKGMA